MGSAAGGMHAPRLARDRIASRRRRHSMLKIASLQAAVQLVTCRCSVVHMYVGGAVRQSRRASSAAQYPLLLRQTWQPSRSCWQSRGSWRMLRRAASGQRRPRRRRRSTTSTRSTASSAGGRVRGSALELRARAPSLRAVWHVVGAEVAEDVHYWAAACFKCASHAHSMRSKAGVITKISRCAKHAHADSCCYVKQQQA